MRRIPDYQRDNNYPLQRESPLDKALKAVPSDSVINEFMTCVDNNPGHGPNGDCWLWSDCFSSPVNRVFFKYIVFLNDAVDVTLTRAVHKISYLIFNKQVPELEMLGWSCNNEYCVNPRHLFVEENEYEILNDSVVARFWSKVDKTPGQGPQGTCWMWKGSQSSGYGELNVNSVKLKATRASWIIHKGCDPRPLLMCHKCDNPPCVNPDHLFPGTAKQNGEDTSRKNRTYYGQKTHCKRGHLYTSGSFTSTAILPRRCKQCIAENYHRWLPSVTRTHCSRGHEFTDDNIHIGPKGNRYCKTCLENRENRLRDKNAGKALRFWFSDFELAVKQLVDRNMPNALIAERLGTTKESIATTKPLLKRISHQQILISREESLPVRKRRIVYTSMSTRVRNNLLKAGFVKLGDISTFTRKQLLDTPGVKRATVLELENYLGEDLIMKH